MSSARWIVTIFAIAPTCQVESHPFHEAIHHALLAGLVEQDGELVAVHRGDVAVAEFEMEYAVADGKVGTRAGRAGHQLAFDGERGARPHRAFRRAGACLLL